MPSLIHTHTYVRRRARDNKGRTYYRCFDKNCTHYLLREDCEGKESACPSCGTPFVLTLTDLKRARPLCLNCRDTIQGRQHRQLKGLVENLIAEQATMRINPETATASANSTPSFYDPLDDDSYEDIEETEKEIPENDE